MEFRILISLIRTGTLVFSLRLFLHFCRSGKQLQRALSQLQTPDIFLTGVNPRKWLFLNWSGREDLNLRPLVPNQISG
jgi:hypothetical protein